MVWTGLRICGDGVSIYMLTLPCHPWWELLDFPSGDGAIVVMVCTTSPSACQVAERDFSSILDICEYRREQGSRIGYQSKTIDSISQKFICGDPQEVLDFRAAGGDAAMRIAFPAPSWGVIDSFNVVSVRASGKIGEQTIEPDEHPLLRHLVLTPRYPFQPGRHFS